MGHFGFVDSILTSYFDLFNVIISIIFSIDHFETLKPYSMVLKVFWMTSPLPQKAVRTRIRSPHKSAQNCMSPHGTHATVNPQRTHEKPAMNPRWTCNEPSMNPLLVLSAAQYSAQHWIFLIHISCIRFYMIVEQMVL